MAGGNLTLRPPDKESRKLRLGHAQALVAVEHSILVSIFYMLQRNQPYHDLGADYFIRQLEAIGYTIQAQPPPPPAAA